MCGGGTSEEEEVCGVCGGGTSEEEECVVCVVVE